MITNNPIPVRQLFEQFKKRYPTYVFNNETEFIRTFNSIYTKEEAKAVFAYATRLSPDDLLLWANLKDIHSPYYQQTLFNNIPRTLIEHLAEIPAYDRLFGQWDLTDCDDCRSIFGPAAYFVDLMRLIETDITSKTADPGAALRLEQRRPDLFQLRLDCDNTYNLIPFVDILLEVLQGILKTDGLTDPDLEAATAVWPNHLPFHRPLAEIRAYLEKLRVKLSEIYRTLGAAKPRLVRELLELSPKAYDLISTASTDEESLRKRYGLSGGDPVEQLQKVPAFLRHSSLSRTDLAELLYQDLSSAEIQSGLHGRFFINQPDKAFLEITADDIGNETLLNLNAGKLDRIDRFVRLSRQLKWSFSELDRCLSSFQADTQAEAVIQFNGVNDEIRYPAPPLEAPHLVLEAWVRPNRQRLQPILRQGVEGKTLTQWMLSLDEQGRLVFTSCAQVNDITKAATSLDGLSPLYFPDSGALHLKSRQSIQTGAFSHIAARVSGRTVTFIINGKVDGNWTLSEDLALPDTSQRDKLQLSIGSDLGQLFFEGVIQEVRIWQVKNDSDLPSVRDIAANRYRRFLDSSEKHLSAYFPLFRHPEIELRELGPKTLSGEWKGSTKSPDWVFGAVYFPNHPIPLAPAGMKFNGANQFAMTKKARRLTGDQLTFEAWIQPLGKGRRTLFSLSSNNTSRPASLWIGVDADRLLRIDLQGLEIVSEKALSNQKWTHLAVVVQPTALSIYLDGVLSLSRPLPVPWLLSGSRNTVSIGRHLDPSDLRYFNGRLKEVRIWNRALDIEIITRQKDRLIDPASPHLAGYWRMDQVDHAAGLLRDRSLSGNDLRLGGYQEDFSPDRVSLLAPLTAPEDPSKGFLHFGVHRNPILIQPEENKRLSGDFTLSCWIKPEKREKRPQMVLFSDSEAADFLLYVENDQLKAAIWPQGADHPYLTWQTSLAIGSWQHLAVTRKKITDGRYEPQLFLDGVAINTAIEQIPFDILSGSLSIGNLPQGTHAGSLPHRTPDIDYGFSGWITDLRILNHANGDEAFKVLAFERNLPVQTPDELIAHFPLTEQIGRVAYRDIAPDGREVDPKMIYDHGLRRHHIQLITGDKAPAASWEQGQADQPAYTGHALILDGQSDYLDLGPAEAIFDPSEDFSIVLWVYPDNELKRLIPLLANQAPENKGKNQLRILLNPNNILFLFNQPGGNEQIISNYRLPSKQWSHLVYTYSAADHILMLFINGKRINVSRNVVLGKIEGPLFMGHHAQSGAPPFFKGKIGTTSLWSRPLSEAEVSAAFQQATPAVPAEGLTAYWALAPFRELYWAAAGGQALTAAFQARVRTSTLENRPIWEWSELLSGKLSGHGLLFAQNEQNVHSAEDALPLLSDYTLECWLHPQNPVDALEMAHILLPAAINGFDYPAPVKLADDRFSHFAISITKGNGHLVVNGQQVAAIEAQGSFLPSGRAFRLEGLRAVVRELRLWNIARTAEHIAALRFYPAALNHPQLVANWPFTNQDPTQTADVTNRHIILYLGELPGEAPDLETDADPTPWQTPYLSYGATATRLDAATLERIAQVSQLRETFNEDPQALCEAWSGLKTSGSKKSPPAYHRRFLSDLSPGDIWPYHYEKFINWNPADPGQQSIRRKLKAGLRITDRDIDLLITRQIDPAGKIALSVPLINRWYRLVRTARLLGLSLPDLTVLLDLLGLGDAPDFSNWLDLKQLATWITEREIPANRLRDLFHAPDDVKTSTGQRRPLDLAQALISGLENAWLQPEQLAVEGLTEVDAGLMLDQLKAGKIADGAGWVLNPDLSGMELRTSSGPLSPAQLAAVTDIVGNQQAAQQTAFYNALADLLDKPVELLPVVFNGWAATLEPNRWYLLLSRIAMDTLGPRATEEFSRELVQLEKLLTVLTLLGLTSEESAIFLLQPEVLGLSKNALFAPGLQELLYASRLADIKGRFADDQNRVVVLLAEAQTLHRNGEAPLPESLTALTGWGKADLNLLQDFLQIAELPLDLDHLDRLSTIYAFTKNRAIGLDDLLNLGNAQHDDYYHLFSQARTVEDLVQVQRSPDDLEKIRKEIHGRIANQRRDALTSLVLDRLRRQPNAPAIFPSDPQALETLSEYLLLDVQTSSEVETSLIVQATASLQQYVQRCQMNLEPGIQLGESFAQRWEWMKNYRVWEANRKVFLYPENYIEPELRDTKTPLFEELEQELLQSALEPAAIERALLNYMDRFTEVSNLKIIGSYLHVPNAGNANDKYQDAILYLVGKTPTSPPVYYYRTKAVRSEQWQPWRQINLNIKADFLTPVFAFNRLFLFWVEFKQAQEQNEAGEQVEVFRPEVTYAYQNLAREWVQPQTYLQLASSLRKEEHLQPRWQRVYAQVIPDLFRRFTGVEQKDGRASILQLTDETSYTYPVSFIDLQEYTCSFIFSVGDDVTKPRTARPLQLQHWGDSVSTVRLAAYQLAQHKEMSIRLAARNSTALEGLQLKTLEDKLQEFINELNIFIVTTIPSDIPWINVFDYFSESISTKFSNYFTPLQQPFLTYQDHPSNLGIMSGSIAIDALQLLFPKDLGAEVSPESIRPFMINIDLALDDLEAQLKRYEFPQEEYTDHFLAAFYAQACMVYANAAFGYLAFFSSISQQYNLLAAFSHESSPLRNQMDLFYSEKALVIAKRIAEEMAPRCTMLAQKSLDHVIRANNWNPGELEKTQPAANDNLIIDLLYNAQKVMGLTVAQCNMEFSILSGFGITNFPDFVHSAEQKNNMRHWQEQIVNILPGEINQQVTNFQNGLEVLMRLKGTQRFPYFPKSIFFLLSGKSILTEALLYFANLIQTDVKLWQVDRIDKDSDHGPQNPYVSLRVHANPAEKAAFFPVILRAGEWNHFAYTSSSYALGRKDITQLQFWLNGRPRRSTFAYHFGKALPTRQPLVFGDPEANNLDNKLIYMGEFRFWSFARDGEAIAGDTFRRKTGEEYGLLHLPFNGIKPAGVAKIVATGNFFQKPELPARGDEDRILVFLGGEARALRSNGQDRSFYLRLDEEPDRVQPVAYDLNISLSSLDLTKTMGLSFNDFASFDSSTVRLLPGLAGGADPNLLRRIQLFEPGSSVVVNQKLLPSLPKFELSLIDVNNQPGWYILGTGDEHFLVQIVAGREDARLRTDIKTATERLDVRFAESKNPADPIQITVLYGRDEALEVYEEEWNGKQLEITKRPQPVFRFERISTYAVHQLGRQLFQGGIQELLRTENQQTGEVDFAAYGVGSDLDQLLVPPNQSQVDFQGAMGAYYQELFFHIPFLVANQCNAQQQFSEAQQWYHYIFNPTNTETGVGSDRYWRYLLFRRQGRRPITTLLQDPAALEAYRRDPFDPHAIAALRISAYQKTVVMKYIDNLLDWGDQLFRQDTRESIQEAAQLYQLAHRLLGNKPAVKAPRTLPGVENYIGLRKVYEPEQLEFFTRDEAATILQPAELKNKAGKTLATLSAWDPDIFHFCVPENREFIAYWDRVDDRLFKIRHSLNFDGVFRSLDLFAPPIDPRALVRAAFGGGSAAAAIAGLGVSVPHYRYTAVRDQALTFTDYVIQLGQTLLDVLKEKDAEALNQLLARQEGEVLEWVKSIKEKEIEAARQNITVLERQKARAAYTETFYKGLIEAGFIPEEVAEIVMNSLSMAFDLVSGALFLGSGVAYLIPGSSTEANASATFGMENSMTIGASASLYSISEALDAFAGGIGQIGNAMSTAAGLSGRLGDFKRRGQEWEKEKELAALEVKEIEAQIELARIQADIAKKELQTQEMQIRQNQELLDFHRRKFTNQELYAWMSGRLSALYFQAYQMAYAMAQTAEKSFQYESGSNDTFVGFGHWDSLRKGFLAGESLKLDILRMDKVATEQNSRYQEVRRRISLRQLDPAALVSLITLGECEFFLPEWQFDADFPGHYYRQIHHLSIGLDIDGPAVAQIQATLVQLKNQTLLEADIDAVRYLNDPTENEAPSRPIIRTNWRVLQQVAVTNPAKDDGMFGQYELNFLFDERYFPFEGTGVVSKWRLEMPSHANPFDYANIRDVAFDLRYTSKYDAGSFKTAVLDELKKDRERSLLLNLKLDYPEQWEKIKEAQNEISVQLAPVRRQLPGNVLARELRFEGADETISLSDPDGGLNPDKPWTLTVRKQAGNKDMENLYLLIKYSARFAVK